MDISGLRSQYNDKRNLFLENDIEIKEPHNIFDKWFKEAQNNPLTIEPNAMCLSTATKDGLPSGRFVLCKGYGKDGFKFFTHYTSRKGQELEENSNAALTFFWPALSKQIRIEGQVDKLSFNEADQYFQSRPYQSQIGALCSDQSKTIQGRHILINNENLLKSKYNDGLVPRPAQWGGYILKPKSIEFWQGQTDRIHDRIRFRKANKELNEPDGIYTYQAEDDWIYERLAP